MEESAPIPFHGPQHLQRDDKGFGITFALLAASTLNFIYLGAKGCTFLGDVELPKSRGVDFDVTT